MNISVNECLPHYVGGVGNYTGNYLGGGVAMCILCIRIRIVLFGLITDPGDLC